MKGLLMRLLLIHLSDLHITGPQDAILTRAHAITEAVQNLDYSLDLCVIVVTGDLSFSGQEEQYIHAWEFLLKLKDLLSSKLSNKREGTTIPVRFVVIPGNHDCDFNDLGGARNLVLDGVLTDPNQVKDDSVVAICTKVQSTFFEFLGTFAHDGLKEGTAIGCSYGNKLYYEYHFEENGNSVRFMCCNTPWLSRLREIQGQLYYPADALPHFTESDHELNVILFHHPYNWLEANSARAFRKRVEQVADLILTGHEHDATRRTQQGERGERNTYIEGGALYDCEDQSRSVFNSFVIDTTLKKQKFTRMVWNGERYASSVELPQGNEGAGLSWEELQVNRLRQSALFELTQDTKRMLDDPGINITHRGKRDLKLSDIYVYPDLRDFPSGAHIQPLIVKGEQLLDLLALKSHLLLLGDSQSGKTSLAKTLFSRLHQGGDIPVLFPGDMRPHTDDRLFGFIENLFTEQYEKGALEAYRQMDRNRRVIIVDDYHKLQLKPSTKRRFLAQLGKFAGRIILLAHEIALLEEIAGNPNQIEGVPNFTPYRVQPLGYLLRNRLVEKWLLLNSDNDSSEGHFVQNLIAITRLLDTLIGKNYVPAYPVYLLSILQASEASTPIDITASTHGYFYELLIRVTLAGGKSQIEFDLTAAYLSHLAYSLFTQHLREVDESTFRRIHAAYEELYDITTSFEEMRDSLIKRHMVTKVGSGFKFKYKYLYYFFVATYMRDHINVMEVREHLKKLSRELYLEESANILLFLAHLSKDPTVVDEMLSAAMEHYKDIKPAQFTDDTVFLDRLEESDDRFVYEEIDTKKTREEVYAAMDQTHSDSQTETDQLEFTDPASPFAKINAAIKTLQILGQILKNFPGSMERHTKLDIVKECTSLGMRVNASFLKFLQDHEIALAQEITELIRQRYPTYTIDGLQKKARQTIVGLAKITSLSLVKIISHAIGSPALTVTYERLIAQDSSPSIRLIDTSIKLDHSGNFPDEHIKTLAHNLQKSPLAMWILRGLVMQHFYLFPVDFRTKQRVCETIGISYTRIQGLDSSKKLIGKDKST